MSKIIEVRGDEHGPLLGRLRGVTARHELRQTVVGGPPINFVAHDAHMVFRGEVPTPLPDLLSTSERQLVVSKRLAKALRQLDPAIELVPLRLVARGGESVASDHAVAVVKTIAPVTPASTHMSPGGYAYAELRGLTEPTNPLPPLFRITYSLAIGCNDAAAAVLEKFSGVTLVPLADYVEVGEPRPPAPYLLLVPGPAGASFSVGDNAYTEALETGQPLLETWPEDGVVAAMRGRKSEKKIVAIMASSGAPVIHAKAKQALEKYDLVDVEFLPVQLQDHAKTPVKGQFWLLHVRATRDYVDIAESDIEVVHDLLWHPREVVLDESLLTDRPPLFRIPGARYPWIFIRSDVAAALAAAKLAGFATYDPGRHDFSVEGADLPRIR